MLEALPSPRADTMTDLLPSLLVVVSIAGSKARLNCGSQAKLPGAVTALPAGAQCFPSSDSSVLKTCRCSCSTKTPTNPSSKAGDCPVLCKAEWQGKNHVAEDHLSGSPFAKHWVHPETVWAMQKGCNSQSNPASPSLCATKPNASPQTWLTTSSRC